MKPTHGGKRKNAGRKALSAKGDLTSYRVSLDNETATKATKLGEGNLSLGIRRSVKSCKSTSLKH